MSEEEEENISWETAIKKSFYYEEYYAYGIEDHGDAITLYGWSKSNDEAYSEGGLYLKKEWILQLINTIRSVPKNELERGTADDGYGEWKREFNIPLTEINEDTELNVSLTNTYYDRSRPKLEIYLFCYDNKKKEVFEHECIKRYETNEITISHMHGLDGYINDVEPILLELEKYVPESEKDKILKELGNPESEIDKVTKRYKVRIDGYSELEKKPVTYWIKKQLDNTHYEITPVVFFNKKIISQKTITLSIKEMAMMEFYIWRWINEIKTIPYAKENPVLKIEINKESQLENFPSAKITVKSQKDFFEIPFCPENSEACFRNITNFSSADKINTDYIKDLEGYVEDSYMVLEWNKHSPYFFRFEKSKINSLLTGLTKKLPVAMFRSARPSLDYEGFSFDVSTDSNDILTFSLSSCDDDSIEGRISMEVFMEDFTTEINKIVSVVEKLSKEKTYDSPIEKSEKLNLYETEEYAGADTRFFLGWTNGDEERNENQRIELPKELIFRIQEYAFWWWRATDHRESLSFESDGSSFSISPDSDKEGFGTYELKVKDKSLQTYFDLQDGTNFPKDFCDYQYKSAVRKIQLKEKQSKNRIKFELWNCKYQELNDKCKVNFSIRKDFFKNFKADVQELYDQLKDHTKKMADFLAPEYNKKYDTAAYWIQVTDKRLALNCPLKKDVDEDIPLDIVFYPKSGSDDDYFSFMGTREILLRQFDLLLNALNQVN